MLRLESFVEGKWRSGNSEGSPLFDPTTGEEIARIDANGIDFEAAFNYARKTGSPALKALSFAERGALLRAIADVLTANREKYGDIARRNSGNTAMDAAIDIDGGIGTLKVYARYGKALGDNHLLMEGNSDQLAKEDIFRCQHMWTSRPGIALHINAFNFPSWGLWEKVAVSLLAGVSAVAKPASATAWLSYEMVRDVVAAGVLPEGALSLICGRGEDLMDALTSFDGLAFTGSSTTATQLRSHTKVLQAAPRTNIEADSVNATILGPDVKPGDTIFDLFVREVTKALTVKAGQLCTNIRRLIVPTGIRDAVIDAVNDKIAKVTVGDPANDAVRMGPLVDKKQQANALAGLAKLKHDTDVVFGGGVPDNLIDADSDKGAFLSPTLLSCTDPDGAHAVHDIEVFGPVASVMPYRDSTHATDLANRAGGSLALSVFSADAAFSKFVVANAGTTHGRILFVDETVGKNHTGHAIVMPQCVHGGPGRAGGGEELGGLRGLRFYMQRSAIQGSPALLEHIASDAAVAEL